MLKTGIMLASRYEIVGRIGSGGMADVYKGMDHTLNRFVAVKIMKPEFQGDKEFVNKFRREAQAAAGLANPNIVNVYDVGEDQGHYYIVMELVEGITLKEYIEKKGKLSVREATSIAIQVSMGLSAAHDQGIIHRDVKPQNIIISTDGKVKVTDFGIARAASSNTISANTMGSVHYSSPEQVRGGFSDSRSDIYSLGITLYEMVTGRVPFDGDTTVAIAIKHLQDEMTPPSKITPGLPVSLEQIIDKCTQKSVDRRYQSMNDVISDLKRSLMDPDGTFVQLVNPNDGSQTTVISDEDRKRIKSAGAVPTGAEKKEFTSRENAKRGFEDGEEPEEEDDDDEGSTVVERLVTIGSILVCALIIGVLLYFIAKAAGLIGNKSKGAPKAAVTSEKEVATEKADQTDAESSLSEVEIPSTITVPRFLGMTEAEAQKTAAAKGLTLKYDGEIASVQAEGTIVSQNPQDGTQIAVNGTVLYVKSSGPAMAEVPSVDGLYLDEAKLALKNAGITQVTVVKEHSDEVELGYAISVSPAAGERTQLDAAVTLTISQGYEGMDDPYLYDYVGVDVDRTISNLRGEGFIVTVNYVESGDNDQDVVIDQEPRGEKSLEYGSEVVLTVINPEKAAEQNAPAPEVGTQKTMAGAPVAAEASDAAGTAEQKKTAAASLLQPANYTNGPYRLTLVQTVNGRQQETVLEESENPLSFPHNLQVEGESDSTGGFIYLYEKSSDGEYNACAQWPIQFS